MGFFDRLSGREGAALDDRVRRISRTLVEKAKRQSEQHSVNTILEARKIGEKAGIIGEGMSKKKRHPADFVDIAMWLLCYPPELAYAIATGLAGFAPSVGWNPFGTVMAALGQIDSLYSGTGMFVRKSTFDEKPEFFEIVSNEHLRLERAGQLLAVAILASSESVRSAREIYHTNVFDPAVRAVLDRELAKYDAQVTRAIISR